MIPFESCIDCFNSINNGIYICEACGHCEDCHTGDEIESPSEYIEVTEINSSVTMKVQKSLGMSFHPMEISSCQEKKIKLAMGRRH